MNYFPNRTRSQKHQVRKTEIYKFHYYKRESLTFFIRMSYIQIPTACVLIKIPHYLKLSKVPCSRYADNLKNLIMHWLWIKIIIIFILILPQVYTSHIASNVCNKYTFRILQMLKMKSYKLTQKIINNIRATVLNQENKGKINFSRILEMHLKIKLKAQSKITGRKRKLWKCTCFPFLRHYFL